MYWARHRRHGCPVAYAVDSRGDRVRQLYVLPTSDPDEAIAYLWSYLEWVDPPPRLQLVKVEPEKPALATMSPLEEERAYCRTVASRGARFVRRFRD